METIKQNGWVGAKGEEDGRPVLLRFRDAIPFGVQEANYPVLINIYWRYHPVNASGMPDKDTNALQIEFESATEAIDDRKYGFTMFVVTGNSRKEWVWYVKEASSWLSAFNNCLNERMAEYPAFPIEIQQASDPEWKTYKSFADDIRQGRMPAR